MNLTLDKVLAKHSIETKIFQLQQQHDHTKNITKLPVTSDFCFKNHVLCG